MQAAGRVRIGAMEVSPFERKVTLGEREIDLPWRCFEALLVLIEANGEIAEREVFFHRLWPNTSVEESNLNQAIARLRKELGDAGNIIETVPRRGYRLLIQPEPLPDTTPAAAPTPRPESRSLPRWPKMAAIGAVLVLAGFAAISFAWPRWSNHWQAVKMVDEGLRIVRDNRTTKIEAATALFSRALELDPKLAIGYAGLAEAMARSVDGSRIHSRVMAERSLQLDPRCAECQGIAGWILLTREWQFADALRYLQAAAREKPNDPRMQLWNAQAIACSGRLDQALQQIDVAVSLNPTDAGPQAMRAGILYFLRRYGEAIAAGRLAIGLRPGDTGATDWIYRAAMASGRIEEAMAARSALMASFGGLSAEARQANEQRWDAAYRGGGLRSLVGELLEESSGTLAKKHQAYDRATLRMWGGDPDGALDELENIFEFHPYHCIYLGVDPVFASVREHPRFRRILGRIGLETILVTSN